ncbi:PIN-like domain-containing protein [Aeromonas caviae]|uniref:PIN-like domain-containing protein n=1 Tax=Aeromonas caviae TaxID=648 RepID=UPI002B4732A7|nr:PIN-like domain-containing protein [Aeromonas caviae]
MKDSFKGYYNTDSGKLKELWESPETLFVFDTNVFLNLYGYAKQTRDDFFKIIEALSERVWIPYHVGLEYQRRRLDVIKHEKSIFNLINKNLEKIQNVFKGDFEQLALKKRFPKLHESTEKLEKEIGKCISSYKRSVKHWDDNQPCVRSNDEIRNKLDFYFDGKVGQPPSDQKWLDEVFKEGQSRFENKIPPGFKDAVKSKQENSFFQHNGLQYDKQFGDYIIWKQLIEKSREGKFLSVVFITDDNKDDWWLNIDSNGKKQVGPLPELQTEIYNETNISSFHMYTTAMFLEDGKTNLSIDVKNSSIEDAENTVHISDNLSKMKLYAASYIDNSKIEEWIKTIESQNNPYLKTITKKCWDLAATDKKLVPEINSAEFIDININPAIKTNEDESDTLRLWKPYLTMEESDQIDIFNSYLAYINNLKKKNDL